MPPPLPPQAVPAPKVASVKPEPEAPQPVFGRTAQEWTGLLQRCPFTTTEKRVRWLELAHGLPADKAAKVLASVGDVPETSIEAYIQLVFGSQGDAARDAVEMILALFDTDNRPELSKSIEAIELRTSAGHALMRRADSGVVLGLTIDPDTGAMRWIHMRGDQPLATSIATAIKRALSIGK